MPALWASLRIAPPDGPPQQWKNPTQWFRSKRALAQRVAPLIESFELENLDSFSTLTRKIAVQAFLDALEPAALASLCIRKCGGTLSEQAAARLLQFTRLQRLELNAYIYADLSCLAQLTALCLEPPRRPEELTRLQQLAELELIQPFSVDAALPLLPASAFPRLTRLAFCASSFKGERTVASSNYNPAMIQLRRAPDDAGAWFLTCGNLRLDQGGTLGDLLSSLAVYPPRIARLLFQGCYLAPAGLDLRACGRDVLPGVTRLLFVQQPNAVGLDRLLRLLPSLEVLNVDDAGIVHSYGFLHALQANPAWPGWNNLPWPAGLNTLQLTNCGLKALPLGLHLAGLRTLVLDHNDFSMLPEALTAATSLGHLSIKARPARLTLAELGAVLARMPALRLLELEAPQLPADVAAAVAQRLPQLRVALSPPPAAGAQAAPDVHA